MFMFFLFPNTLTTHPLRHTGSNFLLSRPVNFRSFVCITSALTSSSRYCSSAEAQMIPFVESSVNLNLLRRTLQEKPNSAHWPDSVQKFCEKYFEGNSEDLKQAFLNTYFSPGLFGAICATRVSPPPSRFEKRPDPETKSGKKTDLFPANASFESLKQLLDDFKENIERYRSGISDVPEFLLDLKKRIIEQMLSDLSLLIGEDESDSVRLHTMKREFDELKGVDQSTYFKKGVRAFFESVEKSIGKGGREFLYSPIPSGVPLRATYKNGLIQSASVDLNGRIIDLTELLRSMPGVPGIISEKKEITFSGYLYLTNKAFRILNYQRIVEHFTPVENLKFGSIYKICI